MATDGGGLAEPQLERGAEAEESAPKKLKSWRQKKRGRRDLLRAVQHAQSKQDEKFHEMDQDPDAGKQKLEAREYPSRKFLVQAEPYLLARYANFLLQGIMQLLRVFIPDDLTKNTFGLGLETSARVALLFMRSNYMPNASAQRLTSVKRHLYARMRIESDSVDEINAVVEGEWKGDRMAGLQDRVHKWVLEQIPNKVLAGTLPLTNLAFDISQQWDDVWQVIGFKSFLRVRIEWAHLSSCVVNRFSHIDCKPDIC